MASTPEATAAATARWRRVRALFEAVYERAPDERASWLAAECGRDPELLAQVESMLAADEVAAARLEPPPAPLPTGGLRGADAADRVGSRVGPYLLERLIGAGGMGAVYLARRADEAFEKRVAVKLIKRGMDTDDLLRRFRTERQVLAGLEHPGVARLVDGGSTEDGLPYLVMEFVDGVALDRWCAARRLDSRARVALFRRVCEAVDFAHRRGVVHRDLKPSNVLVNAEGEPKLLDFGIAKIVDAAGSAGTVDVTATELRLMTPEYASPEQLRGEPVGAPSDVYALGVVLYELLTGRHPHPTRTRQRADLERAICELDPAAPSATVLRPPTSRNPDAPPPTVEELARERGATSRELRRWLAGDLDTIVLAALRKEPDRRYAAAGALADDLGRLLAGLPVAARPDTWRYRTGKLVRRNKALVAATLTVIAVLAAGLATSTALYVRAERARRVSVQREYQARIASATAALEAADVVRARRDLELAPEAERGWEWRHLDARLDRSEGEALQVGDHVLLGIALDPTGRWMAVGGTGCAVILVDRESGEERARADVPAYVKPSGFLDGGRRLAGFVERRGAYVWEVPSLEVAASARPADGEATTHAIDPGERWVAVGSSMGTVELRSLDAGELLRTIGAPGSEVRSLALTASGERLAVACADGSLHLWDAATGARLAGPSALDSQPERLAFDAGGRYIAAGLRDGVVALLDSATLRPIARVVAHANTNVRGVLFHPDGARLATGSLDGTLRVWDVPSLAPRGTLLGHGSAISDVTQDPASGRLLSVDADGRVKAWSWDADEVRAWRGPPGWHMDLDLSPDGARAVTTGRTPGEPRRGAVELRDVATGRVLWSRVLGDGDCEAAAFSADAARICALDARAVLRLLDAASGDELVARQLEGAVGPLGPGIHWIPGGGRLLTAGQGNGFVLRDADSLEPIARSEFVPPGCTELAVHPRGDLLLAARVTHDAALLDARSLETVATLRGHRAGILGAAFSPTAPIVATCAGDETIRLWSVPDGTQIAVLRGHSGWVHDVAFSPDGARLASASADRTVRLWSLPDGREVAALRGHRAALRRVQFAPDGSYLASLSIDGEVRIWDAPPDPSR